MTARQSPFRVVLVRVDRQRPADENHPRHLHPPLDLFTIRGLLEQQDGFQVEVIDGWLLALDAAALARQILQHNPQAVVIRSMSWSLTEACQVSQLLRQHAITTIAIGEQVTHAAHYPDQLPHWQSCWSFPLAGEAEQAAPALLSKLQQGCLAEALQAAYWDRFLQQQVFQVDPATSLPVTAMGKAELGAYPFPFPVRGAPIKNWGYVLSAWGCPYRCQHCTEVVRKSTGSQLRLRQPAAVVDEIEQLLSQGAEGICFEDDTLFCNRRHLLAICDEINRRQLKLRWIANARPDELDHTRVAAAASAGAVLLKVGIESGAAELVEQIGKSANGADWLHQARAGLSLLRQHKIACIALFMAGIPGETEALLQRSIDLALQLDPEYIQVQRFTAYADVGVVADQHHPGDALANLYHYAEQQQHFASMSAGKLRELHDRFYSDFYLRTGYLVRHARLFWRWYLSLEAAVRLRERLAFLFNKAMVAGRRSPPQPGYSTGKE